MLRLLTFVVVAPSVLAAVAPAHAQGVGRMLYEMNRAIEQFGGRVAPPQRDPYEQYRHDPYRRPYEDPYQRRPRFYEEDPRAHDRAPPQRYRQPAAEELTPQQVYELQILLNQLGYSSGTPDGRFGAATRRAIEAFQRAEGLPSDGRPTATLLALVRARGERSAAPGQAGEQVPPPRSAPPAADSRHTPPAHLPEPPRPDPRPVVIGQDTVAPVRPDLAPLPSPDQPPEKESKGASANVTPEVRRRIAADAGDPNAQLALGLAYYHGDGEPRDPKAAIKWLTEAANRGNVEAKFYLATMLAAGDGAGQDLAGAAKLYADAAERGHAAAQFNLGRAYAKGEGVAQNDVEAARWIGAAAGSGLKEAQYALGFLYYEGRGVNGDYGEAARWFRKAAEQQHAGAASYLAYMHYAGQGVPANHPEAVRWARKATELGAESGASIAAAACEDLKAAPSVEARRARGWDGSNEAVCGGA